MHTDYRNRRSIAGLAVLIVLACLLVLKAPPICELDLSSQIADTAACPEMPHKPTTQKSTVLTCAMPCAFANIEIAAPLPNMVVESAMADTSSVKPLRGITEGPAPPPPRTRDRAAFQVI